MKPQLGATKGRIEDMEFDIVDNILDAVEEYRSKVLSLEKKSKSGYCAN